MNPSQDLPNSGSTWSALDADSAASVENSNTQPRNHEDPKTGKPSQGVSSPNQERKTNSLKGLLLVSILPVALIPLTIASIIGWSLAGNQAKKEAILSLETHSLQVSEATDLFILDAEDELQLLGLDPEISGLIEQGSRVTSGLANKNVQEVEAQFAEKKLVVSDPKINTFLSTVVKAGDFEEIYITEGKGFNIASSRLIDDVAQADEAWWQGTIDKGYYFDRSELSQETQAVNLPISVALNNTNAEAPRGVVRGVLSLAQLNQSLESVISPRMKPSEKVQIINSSSQEVLETITTEGAQLDDSEVEGGEKVLEIIQIVEKARITAASEMEDFQSQIKKIAGVNLVDFQELGNEDFFTIETQFSLGGRYYVVTTIPKTDLVSVASESNADINATSQQLLVTFLILALVLGGISAAWILKLAENIANPIKHLATTAQNVAAGDLDLRAEIEGAKETQLLGQDFNNLVSKVQILLSNQQELTKASEDAKNKLENDIDLLLDEVSDAMDGDLTVRANLNSMEMSTVADLFNAIIDSLSEIALQVKDSSGQVSSALSENEVAIRQLAEQSIEGSKDTKKVLESVEGMSMSINEVASNATEAANITNQAYQSVQAGTEAMEKSVEGILSLRTTVGETAKKMKRLGESSQKISQVVSLIEEIALKTNLLAINASVEASRAGEQGQGFAVVAEQVGALAEQSASATKEIAQIVANIQAETSDVSNAMEVGTSQVVDTTKLVESTKETLEDVLKQSLQINELMMSISNSTESQAEVSKVVSNLVERLSAISEKQSLDSVKVAESIQSTASVADQLQEAVSQFKAEEESFETTV